MLGTTVRTGCYGVSFLVHGCWDSRDVTVVGMCDCVKECMSFVMYVIIQYVGWRWFIMFLYLILFSIMRLNVCSARFDLISGCVSAFICSY
jgi:hypothetical protein